MSRIQNLTGIVLHKRRFMENDLIVTVLDEQGQRWDLLAKGAGGAQSKRKSHLELMNLVKGTLYQGKTHPYLQSVSCLSSFNRMKSNLDTLLRVHLMIEIIEKTVLAKDPHPEIFELLKDTFTQLDHKDADAFQTEIALIQLAHHLGFLPSFKHCSHCHKQLVEDKAQWDAQSGLLHCESCSPGSHTHLPLKYRKAIEFFRQHGRRHSLHIDQEEQNHLRNFVPNLFLAHLNQPLKSLLLASSAH